MINYFLSRNDLNLENYHIEQKNLIKDNDNINLNPLPMNKK